MHFQVNAAPPRCASLAPRWLAWGGPLAGVLAAVSMATVLALWVTPAKAQASKSQAASANSAMDAGLFYQLLLGEIELQSGNLGLSYQIMLDAARKTKSEQLFQRSVEIALQARAGEQALTAAQAWQAALPQSSDAHRYVIELLVALGRPAEAMEPLSALLKISAPNAQIALLNSMPRLLTRAPHPEVVAAQLQDTLKPYLQATETRVAAHVALGRVWLVAEKPERALDMAQRAQAMDPQAEGPALLALELMSNQPAAMTVVDNHLLARPDNLGLRLVYARALALTQRYNEAIAQLNIITLRQPQMAAPWFTLGALQLEVGHPKEAITALRTHLDRLDKPGSDNAPTKAAAMAPQASQSEAPPQSERADPDDAENDPSQSRQQTWLLLSQAAEQLGDTASAQAWLNKVDDPKLMRDVLQRRVQILAKQGHVAQARGLIRNADPSQIDDHTKVLIETLVLREAKQWGEAQKVLIAANQRMPNDVELLYEQAMIEEKLNHLADMERLLRKVIELKPDHHHAHNALGYSWAERNMRLPEAKALIQRAAELAPEDAFIIDSLGWVEYRLGNRQEALRLLRNAYKARPDTEIGAHLGEILWVSGLRDEARIVLREARKRDARNEVLKSTLTRLRIDL